jgi:lipase maturation factor 1
MLFKSSSKTEYAITNWLFLRGLALVYFFAFFSLSVQVIGLFGKNGILPAVQFLQLVAAHFGNASFWLLPTIFWINTSDAVLLAVCLAGVLISLLAMCGVCTGFCFGCLWFLYLSLSSIGQDFLSFQWDALLLETGFLAIFLAPWQFLEWPLKLSVGKFHWAATRIKPSILFIWLVRWLLFRLMFESGLVKLASGDPTWHNLTALDFHFFTQPLPMPMSWFAAQAPHWFNAMSVVLVFIIELAIPFLIFTGRKTRIIAAFVLVAFQITIALTGNYAYFNLLTIVLCISLLDDQFIRTLLTRSAFVKHRVWHNLTQQLNNLLPAKDLNKAQNIVTLMAAILIFCISIGSLQRGLVGLLPVPGFLETLHDLTFPYCISNSYGLFAVMTTKRLEIVVEGSNDGSLWQEYEFKYKPGNLAQPLPVVAPHQPRLDWQMWFAALGDARHDQWFINFLIRLLQGQKEVLALLAKNPFPVAPPKYVRASLYDYQFTNASERAKTGNWWKREFVRECIEPIRLDSAQEK